MFGMMDGYGVGGGVFVLHVLIGWIWLIVWTVNSVLLGWLMWVLIKKNTKK